MAYTVSSFDVCVPGFERLRNRNEFILTAPISAETMLPDLLESFEADIQCCDRFDGFDYDEARRVVRDYLNSTLASLRWPNPFNLEAGRGDIGLDEGDEGCTAFMYIEHCTMDEADSVNKY